MAAFRLSHAAAALAAAAGCLAGGGCGGGEVSMNGQDSQVVFRAMGAGRWFPAGRRELQAMVDGFLIDAQTGSVTGRIVSAIAPHAGYVYSGGVAGHTYRALRDNAAAEGAPQVAVVLGFSHRASFRGVALLDGDALDTPLGRLALDRPSAAALTRGNPRIRLARAPHESEHSAENQIPFLQTALPGVPAVVAILGDHDEDTVNGLVKALGELAASKRLLVIASTDLLHDPDYQSVTQTDRRTLASIVALNDRELASAWNPDHQVCCGIGPVLAAMRFARAQGAVTGKLLRYRNSGDDFPDSRGSWVVGYGAVVFPAAPAGRQAK